MEVSVILFDDFEVLDVFGPVEILSKISKYNLNYYSYRGGIVSSSQGSPILTKSMDEIGEKGILLVPGGRGTRELVKDEAFIEILKVCCKKATYVLGVCTGAALLAKTGLLDGRKATSNKNAFEWVQSVNENVEWIRKARWIVNEKYYTSSGVSAGMDMTLGFIRDVFGEIKAIEIARYIEYIWNMNSDSDLFV